MPMLRATGSSLSQMQYIPAADQQIDAVSKPLREAANKIPCCAVPIENK
jgi:hypothetical protein